VNRYERNGLTGLQSAACLTNDPPSPVIFTSQKQTLPGTTGRGPVAGQLGWKDPGVVDDQAIARVEQFGEVLNQS
jgi:hypothetical protein